jgi:glycopeptide antibiotics resistance protein
MTPLRGMIAVFVYTAYLLIVTVYPFEIASDFPNKLSGFGTSFLSTFPTSVDQLAMRNLIKKFILAIPFGILLYYLWSSLKRTKASAVFYACVCSVLINFFYELCQVFFAGRHASAIDLLSKTVGSFCGTLSAGFCPTGVSEQVRWVWWKVEKPKIPLFIALMLAVFPAVAFALQYPWFNFRNWDPRFSLQIGNEATGDKPWLGKIYLAALYNRALSRDEIARHFQWGFSPAERTSTGQEGPVALYMFNEGTSNTLHDMSTFGPPLDLIFIPGSHVRWLPDSNGIEILQPTVVQSHGPATKLFTAFTAMSELSVEVWINPANITQTGSARIIAFSRDWWTCNFMLAQMRGDLVFKVRTPFSGREGGRVTLQTDDSFLTTETFHIVATYKHGIERLYVNGREHTPPVDTADTMIGFAVRRTPIAKIAYSFFYFFPLACISAIVFSIQRRRVSTTFLLPLAIGTGLLSLTEIFQAMAFHRPLDLPLLGYGTLSAMTGALSGIAFAQER